MGDEKALGNLDIPSMGLLQRRNQDAEGDGQATCSSNSREVTSQNTTAQQELSQDVVVVRAPSQDDKKTSRRDGEDIPNDGDDLDDGYAGGSIVVGVKAQETWPWSIGNGEAIIMGTDSLIIQIKKVGDPPEIVGYKKKILRAPGKTCVASTGRAGILPEHLAEVKFMMKGIKQKPSALNISRQLNMKLRIKALKFSKPCPSGAIKEVKYMVCGYNMDGARLYTSASNHNGNVTEVAWTEWTDACVIGHGKNNAITHLRTAQDHNNIQVDEARNLVMQSIMEARKAHPDYVGGDIRLQTMYPDGKIDYHRFDSATGDEKGGPNSDAEDEEEGHLALETGADPAPQIRTLPDYLGHLLGENPVVMSHPSKWT